MTVGELCERMSYAELLDWMVYYSEDLPDLDTDDMDGLAASIGAR